MSSPYPDDLGLLEYRIELSFGKKASEIAQISTVYPPITPEMKGAGGSFGGYLDWIDRPMGTNMGFLVGHGTIRNTAGGC